VLRDVVEVLAPQIERAGGRVTVGDMPVVPGNRDGLTSVFQNLVSNGLKFHADDLPVVEVTSERRPGGWEFAVRDNGVGVADTSGIFEMFNRGAAGGDGNGRGIGLAVCRRVVERHDGRIWAESGPDGGSAFHFSLPAGP
jgi:signal transduction histidine kinase